MADSLVRESAGRYHTADQRFSVEKSGISWYVQDTKQLNELGLPHVLGPFDTRRAAEDAIEEARERKIVPFPKGRAGTS